METVLSLFDGMGVGRLALQELGWEGKYFASETNKDAIALTKYHFPDIIHLGDVQTISCNDLPYIDLLIGGSPCQGFSNEGKRKNFNDPRSFLFWHYVRLLKDLAPQWFLLENVVMKKEWQDIITNCLGVEPIKINSKKFTCQNRDRLYWTNLPIPSPESIEDRGIVVESILEKDVPTEGEIINRVDRVIDPKRLNRVGEANLKINRERPRRVYSSSGKAPTLLSSSNKYNRPKISRDHIRWRSLTDRECESLQGLPPDFSKVTNKGELSSNKRQNLVGNGWTLPVIKWIFSTIRK